MPRYIVERSFPDGLDIPIDPEGRQAVRNVVDRNAGQGVTWIHSYVTPDKSRTYCVYDAPSPQAIRSVAADNGLPVDNVSEVHVLDPYFYS